jgi:uncharacterized protein (TIGR03435 family)
MSRSLVLIACEFATTIASIAWSQSPSPHSKAAPKFEVASVKPCDPHTPRTTFGGSTSPGRVAYTCQSLETYVRQAYVMLPNGVENRQGWIVKIEGGPSWINSDLFQIDAKAEDGTSGGGVMGAMMRSLLEDRFKLKAHSETREVAVYALTVAKSGLKLPKAKIPCFVMGSGPPTWQRGETPPPFCGNGRVKPDGLEVHGSTMADFCLAVSGRLPFPLDRKLIDKTGIAGNFDFDLKWFDDDLSPTPGDGAAGSPLDRMITKNLALLEAALRRVGLQLTPTKGPGEFLVIDHAERPTPN